MQSFVLLMGLEGALEGTSGPNSGKHSYLWSKKKVRRPKSNSEEGARRVQGECKESAAKTKDAPRRLRGWCGERLAVAKGSPGRFLPFNQES